MSELPFDPADLGAMLQRLGAMLSAPDEGPVAWSTVRDTATERLGQGTDPAITDEQHTAYADVARLASGWLDGATTLADPAVPMQLWTRGAWIDHTLSEWKPLVEPLATRASSAFGEAMPQQLGALAPEMAAMMSGPMGQMAQRMGAAMFGMQLGQGIGELSTSVLSTGDLAVPLGSELAVLPANLDAFGEGLGVSLADVRLHHVLRAQAHRRLVAHAPWLATRFASAIDDYARGIAINPAAIEDQLRGLDPSDPGAIQAAIEGGMFEPPSTPEQQAAQRRLGALVALVEGWLDDVVGQAGALMPSSAQLREAGQRRRATGGPAEQTFSALVGLELRPRRQRDAAALWEQLREQRGIEGRDGLWDHPDLLPTDDDLEDTTTFLSAGTIDWDGWAQSAAEDDAAGQADGSSDSSSDGPSSTEQSDDGSDDTSR